VCTCKSCRRQTRLRAGTLFESSKTPLQIWVKALLNKAQQARYDSLYEQHINALHRQGKADSTIDVYAHAVRRISGFFDCCSDRLTQNQLKDYFTALVKSHSWSTVKVDRNGLQFFYKHVLNQQWVWVDIMKLPQTHVLPDILKPKKNRKRGQKKGTDLFLTYI
jgi:hypothetical protein